MLPASYIAVHRYDGAMLQRGSEVRHGLFEATLLEVQRAPVQRCGHMRGVDLERTVVVPQGVLGALHRRICEGAVVEATGDARVGTDTYAERGHRIL